MATSGNGLQPVIRRSNSADVFGSNESDAREPIAIAACDARASPTTRLFGEVQSFVRRDAPGDKSTEWDTDGTIVTAVALSRLVCLNAIGFEYALRVTHYPGQEDDLSPLTHPRDVRVPIEQPGMWITASEASSLARLLDAYWRDKDAYPGRVRDALWFFEHTTSLRYIPIAYVQTVTTLETLTNVETYRNRDQFESRLPALAALVGTALDPALAGSVWTTRSKAVHGQSALADTPEAHSELAVLHDLLRAVLRRAVADEEFRAIFASGASIQRQFPLPPVPRGGRGRAGRPR